MPSVGGLVVPGEGSGRTALIVKLFKRAHRRTVIIDPYTSAETIRLIAFSPSSAELIIVCNQLDAEARREIADLEVAGANLSLYRSAEIHDRWFAVDETWWHSGGSLKDLGRRWTRVSRIEDPREQAETEAMLSRLIAVGRQIAT